MHALKLADTMLFLSTLSLRRATGHAVNLQPETRFLSTLSLRRATPATRRHDKDSIFLSTLSLRRATGGGHISETRSEHFYPRSPCGERQLVRMLNGPHSKFLSTLSLRRATVYTTIITIFIALFLSTLSLRRATALALCSCGGACDFYPRSPCGERQQTAYFLVAGGIISIHALLAESDSCTPHSRRSRKISIHALLAESDFTALYNILELFAISIHALLAESDNFCVCII